MRAGESQGQQTRDAYSMLCAQLSTWHLLPAHPAVVFAGQYAQTLQAASAMQSALQSSALATVLTLINWMACRYTPVSAVLLACKIRTNAASTLFFSLNGVKEKIHKWRQNADVLQHRIPSHQRCRQEGEGAAAAPALAVLSPRFGCVQSTGWRSTSNM